MFFTYDNIWPDGMDFLTMIKAPGCTQRKWIHGMKQRWSRAWDAIYSHSNLRCWEYAFWKHISTNLWEMSWKNSAKQCDNVHRAGKYSDILDCAISMSYIGCATLYSKLPTWQGVRCVPCYISYCPVYISEFYKPILAWGIEGKVLVQPEICQKASAQSP